MTRPKTTVHSFIAGHNQTKSPIYRSLKFDKHKRRRKNRQADRRRKKIVENTTERSMENLIFGEAFGQYFDNWTADVLSGVPPSLCPESHRRIIH